MPTLCPKDEEISSSSPVENPPSLVTQLQQVHGLTKKKVYGAKPARQSFFRDERVRERYRKGTTPSSGTATASQLSAVPNGGGRGITRSKAERLARHGGSPTESHPRHPGMNRRMSAPDAESLASPISFSRPYSLSSPISPTLIDMHMPAAQLTALRPPEANILSDPTWLQQHPPVVPSLTQSQISGDYPGNRWHAGDHNLGGTFPQQPPPAEAPIIPPFMPSALPKQRRQDLEMKSRNNSHEAPSRPTRTSRIIHPEDEEPFIFNDEYVAQTVALFENEVLPAYPNFAAMGEPLRRSATPPPVMNSLTPPRRSFYIPSDQESQPSSPSSYNQGDTYVPHQCEMGQASLPLNYSAVDSPLAYAPTYSPGSDSSLTGWAG
jgi:hypothetical protein